MRYGSNVVPLSMYTTPDISQIAYNVNSFAVSLFLIQDASIVSSSLFSYNFLSYPPARISSSFNQPWPTTYHLLSAFLYRFHPINLYPSLVGSVDVNVSVNDNATYHGTTTGSYMMQSDFNLLYSEDIKETYELREVNRPNVFNNNSRENNNFSREFFYLFLRDELFLIIK